MPKQRLNNWIATLDNMTPFVWKSRIRFVDTDASRRIHYTAMLRHFEAAEHEFLTHIGLPYSQISSREVGFPRVHVEVDFQSPTTYNDLLEIEVWVEKIGTSSFTFAFRASVEGRQAASGRIVVVAMSPATKKSCPIPTAMVEALRSYLREQDATASFRGSGTSPSRPL